MFRVVLCTCMAALSPWQSVLHMNRLMSPSLQAHEDSTLHVICQANTCTVGEM